jgi:hypothetical protein
MSGAESTLLLLLPSIVRVALVAVLALTTTRDGGARVEGGMKQAIESLFSSGNKRKLFFSNPR